MIEILLILVIILIGIALALNWYNFTKNNTDKITFIILNMINVCLLSINFIILEMTLW